MRANGEPIRASSAAYTRSHASARPSPVPRQAPWTAAIVGTATPAIRVISGLRRSRRIASPSSWSGSASERSRPLQNARPSPRTSSARAPPVSAASRLSMSSRTIATLIAFILSVRSSTSSATPSSTVRRTVLGSSDSGIRGSLLGGENLQLTRAHRDPVLVEHVPAIRHEPRLRVAIGLLDHLDVEVDGVVDPCRGRVAQPVGAVVGEDGGRIAGYAEPGTQGEHHDPGRNPLAEHRPLRRHRVDVRVEPIAGERAPADDVRLGDRPPPRALGLPDLELIVGPIQQEPIHPGVPPVTRGLACPTGGLGKSTTAGRSPAAACRTIARACPGRRPRPRP